MWQISEQKDNSNKVWHDDHISQRLNPSMPQSPVQPHCLSSNLEPSRVNQCILWVVSSPTLRVRLQGTDLYYTTISETFDLEPVFGMKTRHIPEPEIFQRSSSVYFDVRPIGATELPNLYDELTQTGDVFYRVDPTLTQQESRSRCLRHTLGSIE